MLQWSKLASNWDQDPRVVECSELAQLLFVKGVSYANLNGTDGYIPSAALPKILPRERSSTIGVTRDDRDMSHVTDRDSHADAFGQRVTERDMACDELVQQGLWRRVEKGYVVTNFLRHNPAKSVTGVTRSPDAERQRRRRERKKVGESEPSSVDEVDIRTRDIERDVTRDIVSASRVTTAVTSRVTGSLEEKRIEENRREGSEGEGEGEGEQPQAAAPLTLVPVEPNIPKPKRKSAATPTLIQDGWEPSPADLAYAGQRGYSPTDCARIAEDFRDTWLSKGDKGKKADWAATWRVWIRREPSFRDRPSGKYSTQKALTARQMSPEGYAYADIPNRVYQPGEPRKVPGESNDGYRLRLRKWEQSRPQPSVTLELVPSEVSNG